MTHTQYNIGTEVTGDMFYGERGSHLTGTVIKVAPNDTDSDKGFDTLTVLWSDGEQAMFYRKDFYHKSY